MGRGPRRLKGILESFVRVLVDAEPLEMVSAMAQVSPQRPMNPLSLMPVAIKISELSSKFMLDMFQLSIAFIDAL